MSFPPVLSAHGLECARGDRTLFAGLGFDLSAGELLLVRGGNGQGKTSLLRLLTGLSTPVAGEVRWRGRSIAKAREDYHREMAYLGHANGIKEELTPLENLRFQAGLAGQRLDQDLAESTLRRLGLGRCLDLPARVLSFGQRRRVALAGLLSAGALLWILDEPLTGLDVHGVALVETLLRSHLDQGGLVVMTTHQPLTLEGVRLRAIQVGRQEDA
ncbi:MAG: cytochrome c biogenesis heme-transporting ATPase CcmA [Pseudomonadota bacterium]